MSKLKIYTYGEPVLRKVAKPLSDIKEETLKLSKDMIATMVAVEGVGLAANQVGVLERIIAVNPGGGKAPFILINPEIIEQKGGEGLEERCLSVPGISGNVTRSSYVLVEGLNLKGHKIRLKAEGLVARILQHEMDHLNGTLFVDRLSLVKKGLLRPKLRLLLQEKRN